MQHPFADGVRPIGLCFLGPKVSYHLLLLSSSTKRYLTELWDLTPTFFFSFIYLHYEITFTQILLLLWTLYQLLKKKTLSVRGLWSTLSCSTHIFTSVGPSIQQVSYISAFFPQNQLLDLHSSTAVVLQVCANHLHPHVNLILRLYMEFQNRGVRKKLYDTF